MITSTIAVFLASIIGCTDAGVGNKGAGACAFFWSLVSWVLCLASYSLWSSFPYVTQLQTQPSLVQLPVWQDRSQDLLTTYRVNSAWFSSSWGCALTASILTFFACGIHLGSLARGPESDDFGYSKQPSREPPPPEALPSEVTKI